MARSAAPVASAPSREVVREAVIQALAEALVASWRRDHPVSAHFDLTFSGPTFSFSESMPTEAVV